MGLFEHFPYTNLHELNLDWLIREIKNMEGHAVLSVNGETGEVVLYKSENIVFPEVESSTWRMVRVADGHTAGVMFQNGLMYVMFDNTAERVYTVDHPPTYPVTSVNGQTGAVTLYQDAGVRFPDVSDGYMNVRREIDKDGTPAIVGIQVDKTKAQRMNGTNRYDIYDSQNPPPYPVESVNGQTGTVVLAIPFDTPLTDSVWMATEASTDHTAGIGRETVDGTVEMYMDTSSGQDAKAYIHFVSADEQYSFLKQILTTDDIPSSSGVVSFNGQTGVVTVYGNTLPIESGSAVTVKDYADNVAAGVGYVENTNTATHNIASGSYVVWKNSLYVATSAISLGDTLSLSNLSAVNNGGLNDLQSKIPDEIVLKPGTNYIGKAILAGYNTGSGNYMDSFFVCDVSHISAITSATLASGSAVFEVGGKNELAGSELTASDANIQPHGVTIELHYASEKTHNCPATLLAVGLTIVCT